ncbi:MAG: hypothetical protein DRG78_03610 [Epsilonproteobacteria bacterium]|nr:MAG: hypothetical protein DRG78_03610 [Campylobacterota bacterium]
MNNEKVRIDGFPLDDKVYVVTNYNGVVKNHGTSIDIPLINIMLKLIDNDEMTTHKVSCTIGLPELSTARIGTIWKNQTKLDGHWEQYEFYKRDISLTFNLEKQPATCIRYLKNKDGGTDYSEIEYIDLNKIKDIDDDILYGSTFTKFKGKNNINYIVNSLELFMSTYLPRNKQIRNELLLYPIDVAVTNYVNSCKCTDKVYEINLDKRYEDETMAFLAYLAANPISRNNISKLWTSLEVNADSEIIHPIVMPYHPKNISFKASGIWINEDTFYIQRINEPEAANEYKVIATYIEEGTFSDDDKDNGGSDDMPKRAPLNNNTIDKPTCITPRENPGSSAGVVHVLSEVKPNNSNLDIESKKDITMSEVTGTSGSYNEDKKDVISASSGKLSGGKGSEKVARVEYKINILLNPKQLELIEEINTALLELVDEENNLAGIFYIDDMTNEHNSLVYSSFNYHHIDTNGKDSWASGYIKGSGIKKKKSGYRKLLIVKLVFEDIKPIYLLEIIRKSSTEAFYGIFFQPTHNLDYEQLEEVKKVIVKNKGRFKGKEIIQFPIEKVVKFKHKWGSMKDRFRKIFIRMQIKKTFN